MFKFHYEVWKPVVGYEGLYEVSNYCRVKSMDYRHTGLNHLLSPGIGKDNYHSYTLMAGGAKKCYRAHRLGMEAFIPNPNNYPIINHKDCNRSNNFIYVHSDGSVDPEKSNLEWCTHSYNNSYSPTVEKRLVAANNGCGGCKPEQPVLQFTPDGLFIKKYKSVTEAGRALKYSHSGITACLRGRRHTAAGYIWKYA